MRAATDQRGQGIARARVADAEQRFAAAGGARADAMVLVGDTEGTGAWAALGYQPQEQWRRWVKMMA